MDELCFDTPWVADWRPEFVGTLMFLVDDGQVLLIHKKTGHGAGRINGPGGKWHRQETLAECAVRETREEVGVEVLNPTCRMEMRFVERRGPQWLGFAFVANRYQGEPHETPEALPFWCPLDQIPYDRMWPDDAIWLPKILSSGQDEGRWPSPLVCNFLFHNQRLLDHRFVTESSVAGALGPAA